MLLCQGTAAGGYSLFVKDGTAALRAQLGGSELLRVAVRRRPSPRAGTSCASSSNQPDSPTSPQGHGSPGRFQLYIDGSLVGDTDVPYTTPFAFNPGALTCGANPGSTVTDDYQAPFRFTGTLHTVTVDLSGELITRPRSRAEAPPGPPIAAKTRTANGPAVAPSACGNAGSPPETSSAHGHLQTDAIARACHTSDCLRLDSL